MRQSLRKSILSLSDKEYIDKEIYKKFCDRIDQGPPYYRDEGAASHFCTFLIPVNLRDKKIFIGHHIKADSWMPPGGHIDVGESPLQTVKREWQEELKMELTSEKIQLFDISIIQINNPKFPCKTHYDFWHLVHCEIIKFNFDKREFYKAGWYDIKNATKLVTNPVYLLVFDKLAKYFFRV